MGLKEELDQRRSEIHTDGYPMSIGEIINLYRDEEIDLHPEFQRFFRWNTTQKSRLIESILLGIPLPSIFVAQRADGVWDVIDGLQRLSTVLEFLGILKDETGQVLDPLVLEATDYLPSLADKVWQSDDDARSFDSEQQRLVKRAKLDIKIILRESSESSKYEMFQRLNTGGSTLSDQEVRNCVLIMVDRAFYQWLRDLARLDDFRSCISLTDRALEEQYDLELVARFLVLRRLAQADLSPRDLGRYLTDSLVSYASDPNYDKAHEEQAFQFTFSVLANSLGLNAFRKYVPGAGSFTGGFLISAFEAVALGVGNNYEAYTAAATAPTDVDGKVKGLWSTAAFLNGIGSGVRASSRIPVTVTTGRNLFAP